MAEEGTGGAGSIEIPQPLIITNPKSKTSLRTIPIPDILKKYV